MSSITILLKKVKSDFLDEVQKPPCFKENGEPRMLQRLSRLPMTYEACTEKNRRIIGEPNTSGV